MNCRDTLRLLNGYVDAELDLPGVLAMEQHLQACRGCRAEEASLRALRTAVQRHGDAGGVPDALRERLQSSYAPRKTGVAHGLRGRLVLAIPAFAAVILIVLLGFKGLAGDDGSAAVGHTKVVYHISQTSTASAALRTLANHLEAAPGVQVVVVTHNNGIDFLLRGARDETGELYEAAVKKFSARGVQFRVCNNTLVRQSIEANRVVPEATLVPSGIAEIGRLQSEEGYAYMRL